MAFFTALQSRIPTQCQLCQRWPVFSPLCAPCLGTHARAQPRCSTCAQLLPPSLRPGLHPAPTACADCLRHPPPLAACWAAVDYAAPWRDLLRRWKFVPQPALAAAGAQVLRAQLPWKEIAASYDALLPINPSAARLRERGFHHPLLLAHALDLPLPVLAHSLLRLPEANDEHQARRGRRARFAALKNAFIVPPEHAASLQGQRLLLLDDVMTTGATLYSAANCLLQAGAAQVSAVVWARTPRA